MDKIDLLDEDSAISEDLIKTHNANGKSNFKLMVLGAVVFQCFISLKYNFGYVLDSFSIKLDINPFYNYLVRQILLLILILLGMNFYLPKVFSKAMENYGKINRLIIWNGILLILILITNQLLVWYIESKVPIYDYTKHYDVKYWEYINMVYPIFHIGGIILLISVMWRSLSKL